jgi:hypothetical protein
MFANKFHFPNNMKKTFLACFAACAGLVLASAQTAVAQTVNVAWGPTLKEARKTATTKIIGNDDNGFYTLRSDYSDMSLFNRTAQNIILERYDTQNKLVFSKDLILPTPADIKGKFKFEDIYYLNGQLVLFSSYLNKETGKNTAFANKVSPEGVIDQKMVEVSTMTDASKKNAGDFEFVLSNDSSKILVYNNLPYEKNEAEKFQFRVVDQNLATVSSKTIAMKQLDKDASITNYKVDNEGNVYVLVSTNKDRDERSSKEQKFTYRVLGYFFKEDLIKEYEIKIPNKFVTDITFNIDKNKNLIVAGFYAEDKKLKTEGSFFLKVDFDSKQVLTQGIKKFSPEFMEMFMSKSKAKRDDAGVAFMSLDKLIVREDGGALLIAEQARAYVVTTTNSKGGSTTTYHYVNNDIVFVNVNPDGSIQWISRVPKKQHTVNDGGAYSSYSVSIVKDKIFLIYNDHIKNIGEKDPKQFRIMTNPAKAVTMLATVDNTGKFTRTALFPAKDQKAVVRPSFYLQGNDSVIIYSETGRDYRYGNIKFN